MNPARRRFFTRLLAAVPLAWRGAHPTQAFAGTVQRRFFSGIEIVTITATVTDADGRLVPNVAREEFEVFEDGLPQRITHFTRERVPVSLAVLLDISQSMAGERLKDALRAIDRFFFDLMDANDEFALLVFNHAPTIAARWSSAPEQIRPALDGLRGWGGTAIYDAIAASLPLFDSRNRQRAAAVVISDGADTASDLTIRDVRARLRHADAFVYAIAIDKEDPRALSRRVNPHALREITEDSGGYTAVVHDTPDLSPATARIAEELNQQYTLGYSPPHQPDDKFHSIRVRVTRPGYRVRARRGYVATIQRRRLRRQR